MKYQIKFSVFLFLLLTTHAPAQPAVKIITPDSLEKLMTDTLMLVDVRTGVEYDQWHLENATHANCLAPNFEALFEGIDKSTPVYLYCRSGHRSIKAGEKLVSGGFTNVYSLQKGTNQWLKARKPVIFY